MSIESLALVLHHSRAKGTDKVILIGIANHDGDLGAHPGIPTLAKYGNVAESSAREAVRRLEKLGEVRVRPGAGPLVNGGRTNGYDVLVTCPPECDGSKNHKVRKTDPSSTSSSTSEAPSTPTGPPVGVENLDPHRPTGDTPHRPTGDTPHRPTGAEPSLEPSKNLPPTPEPSGIPADVAKLWEGEGIDENEQTALWADLVADPETLIPRRRAIQAAWYVPAVAALRAKSAKDKGSALEQLRRYGPDCKHGTPGGAAVLPANGLPLCPLCRAQHVNPARED